MIRRTLPRTAPHDFEDEDDVEGRDDPQLSDRDDPDPADMDDDEGDEQAETVACPYCRKPLYEGAEICPHCNSFISFEDARRRYPWWVWVGVILCLLGVFLWAL